MATGRRPDRRLEQLGHPPRQLAGDLVVGDVLVGDPPGPAHRRRWPNRSRTSSAASCTHTCSGLARPIGTSTSVGSRSASTATSASATCSAVATGSSGCRSRSGNPSRCSGTGAQPRQRPVVLGPTGGHHVVARPEPRELRPPVGRIDDGRREAAEHGDHRRSRMRRQERPAADARRRRGAATATTTRSSSPSAHPPERRHRRSARSRSARLIISAGRGCGRR